MISEVYHEDCRETLSRLQTGSIDLLLQDTPFGVTKNSWDIKPDLQNMWPEWLRVCKKNAAIIFFATQPFASKLILSNEKIFRYDLIWYKVSSTGFLNANKMPLRSHESILVFYKSLPTYNPQKTTGHERKISTTKHKRNSKATTNYGGHGLTTYDSTERHPESLLVYEVEANPIHPTQKPVNLLRCLIRTYTNPYDTVFDGYVGSGSTRVAAYAENRNFKGAEKLSEYFLTQEDRFLSVTYEPLFDAVKEPEQVKLF